MSSNLQIKKVCQHCGKEFIAKKTTTKFCSTRCGQRNYKIRERMNKVEPASPYFQTAFRTSHSNISSLPEKLLVDIRVLAFVTSISVRTMFRLIKEPDFPKVKIGRRLLFDPRQVLGYLKKRYGSGEIRIYFSLAVVASSYFLKIS